VVNAGGWSAQVGGRRRWVVGAGGWSAQVGSMLVTGACPDRGKSGGFHLIRLAGVNVTGEWCQGNQSGVRISRPYILYKYLRGGWGVPKTISIS
jgi:hypothetical protein